METTQDIKKHVEGLMGQVKCSKGFSCYHSDFNELGKVKDIGMDDLLECHSNGAADCEHSFSFGFGYFCKCPIRFFVARNLGK